MGMILVTASVAVFVWAVVAYLFKALTVRRFFKGMTLKERWSRRNEAPRIGRAPVGIWVISVILLVVGISMLPDDPDGTTIESERQLAEALAYLNDVDDVTWMEVDRNNVYLGFGVVSEDLALIVNDAAMNGNEVLGLGVHVWAVQADLGWRPGQPGLLCEATARGGQFENTCEP